MKKTVISLLFAAALLLSLTAPFFAVDAKLITAEREAALLLKPGDVDGNGRINALDVVAILRHLVGYGGIDSGRADYNSDGKVNALDVILIMKSIVKGTQDDTGSNVDPDPNTAESDDLGEWLPLS